MAENSQVNPMVNLPPREEYKGPGRFSSALGGYWLWTLPAALVASIASFTTSKRFNDTVKGSAHLSDAEMGVRLKEFLKNNKSTTIVLVTASIASVVAGIYGAIRGWNNAESAKDQFDNVQNQRDAAAMQTVMLGQENEQLRVGVDQLQQVAGHLQHTVLEQQKKLAEVAQHPAGHTKDHAHEAGYKTGAHPPHSDATVAGHGASAQKTEHAHAAATGGHAKAHTPTHEKPYATANASTMEHMGTVAAAHDKQVAANDAGHKPDGHAAKQDAPLASHAAAEHAKAAANASTDLKIA